MKQMLLNKLPDHPSWDKFRNKVGLLGRRSSNVLGWNEVHCCGETILVEDGEMVPAGTDFGMEAIREASAKGAGLELPRGRGRVVPMQKEGDTLEVIVKGRLPRNARHFFGTFGGRDVLACRGAVERMVLNPDLKVLERKFVAVIFVKLVRPTKVDRLAYKVLAADTPLVEGDPA